MEHGADAILYTLNPMARYFFGIDGTMLVERRSTPRFDAGIAINVMVAGGGSIRGMTQNISEAGMQIVLPKAVSEGRLVDFECPDFAGSAQVVWMREDGPNVRLGLRYISLAQDDRDSLVALIADLRQKRSSELLLARG